MGDGCKRLRAMGNGDEGGKRGGGAMRLRGRAARSRKISRRTSRGVQKIDIVFAEGRAWACSWVEGPGDSRPAQKGRRPAGGTTRRRARRRAGLALGGSVSGSDIRTGSPRGTPYGPYRLSGSAFRRFRLPRFARDPDSYPALRGLRDSVAPRRARARARRPGRHARPRRPARASRRRR